MTALSETTAAESAYNSLNSTLAESGWRMEWVKEDVGVWGDLIIKWETKELKEHCPDICVVFGLDRKAEENSQCLPNT